MLELFFSPRGRIGRQTWWFGVLGFIGLGFMFVIVVVIPLSWDTVMSLGQEPFGGRAMAERFIALIGRLSTAFLVFYAVLAFPFYCLSVKRRHDRGNPGWDVLAYGIIYALPSLLFALGWGISVQDIGKGMTFPVEARWMTLLSSCLSLFSLYLVVMLGLLKGTTGPNAYGPDPLAEKQRFT